MKELQDKFDKLTVRFNIPIKRRNISEPNNREWLKRNMFIQNKDFPEFGEALEIIKQADRMNIGNLPKMSEGFWFGTGGPCSG
jgi:hypothetical protein